MARYTVILETRNAFVIKKSHPEVVAQNGPNCELYFILDVYNF